MLRRSCPALMNMSSGDLAMRLLRLRMAMPESNISTIVRRRPRLLLDAVCFVAYAP